MRLPASLRLSWPVVAGALLVMVAVSVYLRTRQLHFFFWIDEGLSVGIASHPLSHIPGLLRQDGSPPLYYLILHAWMSWRGHSEVATHELSLLFALLCIPAAYWMGASLFGRRVGLISAGVAATLPYLNTYAQETRMYSLMALLGLFVAGAFVHTFVYRHRRYLPLFSVSLAAVLYTHNWGLFLGLMCAVCFLWCLRRERALRPELMRDGALAFGAVVVLFAPWLPTLLYQVKHTGAPWDLPPVLWSLTQGLYFIVGGRGVAMLILIGAGAGLLAIRAATVQTAAQAGGPASQADREALSLRIAAESLLILGFGTLLVAWAYSKHTPAWAPRYFAAFISPLILATGLALSRGRRLGLLAMVLIALFWVMDPVTRHRYAKSNVALVADQLRPHVTSNTIVLSTQPEQVPVLAYYLPEARRFFTPLGAVPDPRVMDWRDALARLRRSSVHGVLAPMIDRLKPGTRVLLVTTNLTTEPEWMVLINTATARWTYFLSHDPRLRTIAASNWNLYQTGVGIQGTLYEVVR